MAPESWRRKERPVEVADLRGEVELLLQRLFPAMRVQWADAGHAMLQQPMEARMGGRALAVVGTVATQVRKAFDADRPVFHAVLDVDAIGQLLAGAKPVFAEVPRFPSVRRDLSMLVDQAARFEDLRQVAFDAERKLLRSVGLFDVYAGDKLPAGRKSYAMSFVLQDPAATLTDKQVNKAMERIRQALEKEVGAELRG
jgi:phenylalanyl-tRNA synthetase beta chain